jgi:hypothetical protein
MAEEPGTGAHFMSGLVGKMRGLFTTVPEEGGLGGTGHRGAAEKLQSCTVSIHSDILC